MHNTSNPDDPFATKKRHKLRIMFEVLQLCKEPQKQTRIMQDANLSYKMSKAVIEGLVEYKLLEPTGDSNREYVTSPKGKEYLQKFNELEEMIYKNSTYTKNIPR